MYLSGGQQRTVNRTHGFILHFDYAGKLCILFDENGLLEGYEICSGTSYKNVLREGPQPEHACGDLRSDRELRAQPAHHPAEVLRFFL
jgi:hypothetical protein